MLVPMRPSGVVSCLLQLLGLSISRLSNAVSLAHSWLLGPLTGSWVSGVTAYIPPMMAAHRIVVARLRIIAFLFISCLEHTHH